MLFKYDCSCIFFLASWAEEDVDPSLFPREFLANASDLVGNDDEVVSSDI